MFRPTQDPTKSLGDFVYRALTFSGSSFQMIQLSPQVLYRSPTTPTGKPAGLGSFPFARRYLGNRFFFLFLQLLRCFSSLRLPSNTLTVLDSTSSRTGFPHSDISGSLRTYRSPKPFVVSHVLLRLLVPRHSPCALFYLTYSSFFFEFSLSRSLFTICFLRLSRFFARSYSVFNVLTLFLRYYPQN